jgi:hypothetical protein
MNWTNEDKGIYIRKSLFAVVVVAVALVYITTVLGLVFGLRNSRHQEQSQVNNESTNSIVQGNGTFSKPNSSILVPKSYRLPGNLKPFYYDVQIETNFDKFTKPIDFDGHVRIDIECIKTTNQIVLHTSNLKIHQHSLVVKSLTQFDFEINKIECEIDSDADFLILRLSKPLADNQKYSLFIKYKGFVNGAKTGLFRRSYKDDLNRTRYHV